MYLVFRWICLLRGKYCCRVYPLLHLDAQFLQACAEKNEVPTQIHPVDFIACTVYLTCLLS